MHSIFFYYLATSSYTLSPNVLIFPVFALLSLLDHQLSCFVAAATLTFALTSASLSHCS